MTDKDFYFMKNNGGSLIIFDSNNPKSTISKFSIDSEKGFSLASEFNKLLAKAKHIEIRIIGVKP